MQATSPVWKWLWSEGGKNLPSSDYRGNIISFDNPGYTYPKDIAITINPVQSGSGDPSPSNVRPINGWTGVNVCRSVYNFINPKSDDFISQGTITIGAGVDSDNTARIRSDYVDLDAGTYTISDDNEYEISIRAYTDAGTYIRAESTETWQTSPYTFTLSEHRKIRFVWRKSNNNAITPGDLTNPILCSGTSAHLQKYFVTWQSTAGTVYGGALDVVTGVLTVTHSNISSYAGETLPGTWISDRDVYTVGGTPTTGAQVVYELATPVTYQLTPTAVTLLAGANTVWADVGETSLTLASPIYMFLETEVEIDGTVYAETSAPVIIRSAMQDSLSIGNVVSASLMLSVRTGAAIARSAGVKISVRLNDGETASEWLPEGTFYISRRTRDPVTGMLALECYDALLKANAIWEPSSGAWPRAMGDVVTEFLTLLDVSLDSRTTIPSGAAFVISKPTEGTTIRDVLGTIAQAGGGNWIMTPDGKLRLVPLVSAAGAEDAVDDVAEVTGVVGSIGVNGGGTITGVRDTWEDDVYLTGDDDGIVVDVSIPPVMATEMAVNLIGQSYQAYSLTGAIYDPAAEIGDYVRGGAEGEVASALYHEQVSLGPAFRGDLCAPEAAELADEYPYIGANARTLALAKASVREAVDALDAGLNQQEIFNRLTNNGDAQGLILYNGDLYVNASYIQTGTLNAALVNVVNLNADNITSGAIGADRIKLNEYDPDFLIPDENDASTLFSGQSISNGWIVESGGLITVLKIPNAAPYRGMSMDVSLTSIDQVYGGSEYVMYDDSSEEVTSWTSPTYGQEDGTGALVGATMEGSYYKFKKSFVIPDGAAVFEVSFSASGVKGITASTGIAGNLNLRYLNNISLDSTGLQVGKMVVDRTGNATFNASATFYGGVTGIVKSSAISATTDASGDISLNLNTSSAVPIAFSITGGSIAKTAARQFLQNGDGTIWRVKFVNDSTLANITNTSVEGTVYYMEI